jgi:hypothetical protein
MFKLHGFHVKRKAFCIFSVQLTDVEQDQACKEGSQTTLS